MSLPPIVLLMVILLSPWFSSFFLQMTLGYVDPGSGSSGHLPRTRGLRPGPVLVCDTPLPTPPSHH